MREYAGTPELHVLRHPRPTALLSSLGNNIFPHFIPYFAGVNGKPHGLPLRPQPILKWLTVAWRLEGGIAIMSDDV
jgi:hypothetical protein